jgi:hypothetical protein
MKWKIKDNREEKTGMNKNERWKTETINLKMNKVRTKEERIKAEINREV